MRFTNEQILIAKQLKRSGLPWEPQVGHYVFDQNGICPKSSPFQARVYFLLNFDCFMQHVGGLDRFRANMVWLPTWHDAREVLAEFGLSDREVAGLVASAIAEGEELTRVYALILDRLESADRPGSKTKTNEDR